MCNAGSTADYLFCATRSGDIVKLYVDFLADDGSKTASVVAIAVKKAAAKKGVNAAKFTGGTFSKPGSSKLMSKLTFENGFLIFSWFHAENHLDLFQLCRKLFWKLPLNMAMFL